MSSSSTAPRRARSAESPSYRSHRVPWAFMERVLDAVDDTDSHLKEALKQSDPAAAAAAVGAARASIREVRERTAGQSRALPNLTRAQSLVWMKPWYSEEALFAVIEWGAHLSPCDLDVEVWMLVLRNVSEALAKKKIEGRDVQ